MNGLRKLALLAPRDKWLIVKSATLLALVRSALWLLPFPATRRLLGWLSHTSRGDKPDPVSPLRLAWAVSIAGRAVPGGAHCLTQALVTQVLLGRRGHLSEVCFGIDPNSAQKFMAHAWVETDGMVVIGGPIDGYIRLTPLWKSTAGRPLDRKSDQDCLKQPPR